MNDKDDGGMAFPRLTKDAWAENGYCGMTLRDYFAAKAMQAILHDTNKNVLVWQATPDVVAKNAYVMADFMLKERQS